MNEPGQGDSSGVRYLALLDILGFRSIVGNNTLEEIALRLKKLQQWLRDYARDGTPHEDVEMRTFFHLFSDSILIYSEDDDPRDGLLNVCRTTDLFLYNLLAMGFPVRGAITHGELFISGDRRVFFGRGLIRGYELEQGQKWIGAVVDPRMRGRSDEEDYLLDFLCSQGELRTYAVPWRNSPTPREHLVVNWPHGVHGLDATQLRSRLRELDSRPSEDARAMHEETIDFFLEWEHFGRKHPRQAEYARSVIGYLERTGQWENEPEGFRRIMRMRARSDSESERDADTPDRSD